MVQPNSNIEATIGYHFSNRALLEQALTHSSCNLPSGDNQRLEFLGDAVLDLIIAETLFKKFPSADEGDLDRGRASLVNGRSLSKIAESIHLSDDLIVGEAHKKHQPTPSKAMLEDALEAIIGAAFIDGQLPAAKQVVGQLFANSLEQVQLSESSKNPKGRLQEWSQKNHGGIVPVYKELPAEGPDHSRVYAAAVYLDEKLLGRGTGSSKKSAEADAANAALKELL